MYCSFESAGEPLAARSREAPRGAAGLARLSSGARWGTMGVVLAGIECKWLHTHPQQGEFTLEPCRAAFAYARQNQQQFRGHKRCTTFEMWNFIDGHEASVTAQPWAEVFDGHYRPKPQFSALIDVLKGAASL